VFSEVNLSARSRGSRPAWVPVQLEDNSRVWISAIIISRVTETGGVNGTIGQPVNITANGHAIGVIMMSNVTSSCRAPQFATSNFPQEGASINKSPPIAAKAKMQIFFIVSSRVSPMVATIHCGASKIYGR
jgi:hypothetical protein